jgi:hypothetical protein
MDDKQLQECRYRALQAMIAELSKDPEAPTGFKQALIVIKLTPFNEVLNIVTFLHTVVETYDRHLAEELETHQLAAR